MALHVEARPQEQGDVVEARLGADTGPQASGGWADIVFTVPAATPPQSYAVSVDAASVNYAPGGNIGTITNGSIDLPEVLWPYMGGVKRLEK